MTNWVSDNRKIGIGLTGFGSLFLVMGVMFLFDRALLALGNFLFLAGITLLIGTKKTVKFFLNPAKIRGSICFGVGVVLVLIGYSVIGMLIESFGIINLFGYVYIPSIASHEEKILRLFSRIFQFFMGSFAEICLHHKIVHLPHQSH